MREVVGAEVEVELLTTHRFHAYLLELQKMWQWEDRNVGAAMRRARRKRKTLVF
jgi:hypothetical protein